MACTRMPQFGEADLRALPGLFEKVDSLPVVELPEPKKRNDRRKYREAGHLVVGDKGLSCVACATTSTASRLRPA